jgi:hypothetical protein
MGADAAPYNNRLAELRAQQSAYLSGGGQQQKQPAAPAGMKQVGTSGGKPVYEDAKGNRFTL